MKILALLTALIAPSAFAGSVYDHINSAAFKAGVITQYLASVAGNAKRTKLINAAQEECGGRYEGTEVNVLELKHEIDASDKQVIHTPNPKNYSLKYKATSKNVWQVTEIIKCSVHGGHNQAVLSARLMSGVETAEITYKFEDDNQIGDETVNYVSRKYSPHSMLLEYSYQTPYGTKP